MYVAQFRSGQHAAQEYPFANVVMNYYLWRVRIIWVELCRVQVVSWIYCYVVGFEFELVK